MEGAYCHERIVIQPDDIANNLRICHFTALNSRFTYSALCALNCSIDPGRKQQHQPNADVVSLINPASQIHVSLTSCRANTPRPEEGYVTV
jgi:hypothetical protein